MPESKPEYDVIAPSRRDRVRRIYRVRWLEPSDYVEGRAYDKVRQPLIRWLVGRGMTTNHRQLGELATHGRRSIDAVAVQASLVVRGGADRG